MEGITVESIGANECPPVYVRLSVHFFSKELDLLKSGRKGADISAGTLLERDSRLKCPVCPIMGFTTWVAKLDSLWYLFCLQCQEDYLSLKRRQWRRVL